LLKRLKGGILALPTERGIREARKCQLKPKYALYGLENDPAEKHNVIGQNPEVSRRMKAELKQLLDNGRSRPLAGKSLLSKDESLIIRKFYFMSNFDLV
jgi:hypothetical protein